MLKILTNTIKMLAELTRSGSIYGEEQKATFWAETLHQNFAVHPPGIISNA